MGKMKDWTYCEDEMPTEKGTYWATDENECVFSTHFNGEYFSAARVIAWIKLPNAAKPRLKIGEHFVRVGTEWIKVYHKGNGRWNTFGANFIYHTEDFNEIGDYTPTPEKYK
jgi:hypothetical protein